MRERFDCIAHLYHATASTEKLVQPMPGLTQQQHPVDRDTRSAPSPFCRFEPRRADDPIERSEVAEPSVAPS